MLAPEWLVPRGRLGVERGCSVITRKEAAGFVALCGATVQRLCPQASPAPRPDPRPFWLVRDKSGWATSAFPGWPSVSAVQRKGGVAAGWENSADRLGCWEARAHSFPGIAAWEWPVNAAAGQISRLQGLVKVLLGAPLSLWGREAGVTGRCLQPSDSKECDKHSPSIHLDVTPNPGRLPPGTKESCQT